MPTKYAVDDKVRTVHDRRIWTVVKVLPNNIYHIQNDLLTETLQVPATWIRRARMPKTK